MRIDIDPAAGLAMGEVVRLHLAREIPERGAWIELLALSEAERGLWSAFALAGEEGRTVVRREAVEILHVDDGRAYVPDTFADGVRVVAEGVHRIAVGQPVAPLGSGADGPDGRAEARPTD